MTFYHQISILFLSLAIALFWFLTNFLASEDATVLFNRSNHLNLSTFFYYNGYISAHPQLIASFSSEVSPVFQALIYAAVAFGIWCLLFLYMYQINRNIYLTLTLIAYFSIFDQTYIINLTYSLWTGLCLIGLIGLCASLEDRTLSLWEGFLVAVLAFASPLTVFLIPLFLYRVARWRQDRLSQLALILLAVSFVVLPDPDSHRTDVISLLRRLISGTYLMITDPRHYMLDADHSAVLTLRSLSQWFALLIFVVGALWLIVRTRAADRLGYIVFSLCFLTIFLVSLAASEWPLQSRYWFPILVATGVILGLLSTNLPLWLQRTVLGAFLLAAVAAHVQRGLSWDNLGADLVLLSLGHSQNTSILRERYGNGPRWAIGLGNYYFSEVECRDVSYHPNAEAHGFRIYCGKKLGFLVQ